MQSNAKIEKNDPVRRLVDLTVDWQLHGQQKTAAEIVRTLFGKQEFLQAFRWMQRLDDLSGFDPAWLLQMRKLLPSPFLCLGGGADYAYPSWENLESNAGPLNPKPFDFGAYSKFPYKARSFQIVYAPMDVTALAQDRFANVVSESARVLAPGGALIAAVAPAQMEAFGAALSRAGFEALSTDREKIAARFDYIPRIAHAPAGAALVFATRKG